ncbi:MAG: dynamin family protein [Deltaproteobacteria bacterium]|nr:dynamin family protein [Deltaproteobacteria bacterium]
MLEHYQERKQDLITTLRHLSAIADRLGMVSLRVDIEGARIPKLMEGRFNLVILGEFNHGKSTFVNALLGEELVPVGITPTTATINHVVYGEEAKARVVLRDGGTKEIAASDLAAYVTLEGEHTTEDIRFVELSYPSELLRDRITLVDTPGVNDINQARAEVTYSYIPRADAVVFLLDSTQVLKQSERAFIQRRLLKRNRDKLIFVLGKVDLIDDDEQAQALAFAQEHLAAVLPDPEIFALSARRYLEGDREGSGMAPLLAYLQRFLQEERGRILLDNAATDAKRTIAYLRSSIGIKRGSLNLTVEELDARVADVRRQLEGSRANLDEISSQVKNEGEAIKATVRHDLRLFLDRFCEALPQQIDAVDAQDVKRYLQFYIQDKIKEWAELEGDKVGELLEHLAEEIIKVANENIHATLDAVVDKLGADETHVDLQVDTLKYDASVFALGALGTTIFLFVNTFVGGLLTLAAPLLAVVFREKLGGQVKKQAKKQAPEAIRRAGDAMGPRFEEIVDRFVERLQDFIISAGSALHRGISEILDRALAERRTRSADAHVAQDDLNAQSTELAEIDRHLDDLREALWQSPSGGEPTGG